MKKQFSESAKPRDPPDGAVPSSTTKPQQKVGAPAIQKPVDHAKNRGTRDDTDDDTRTSAAPRPKGPKP